ncbi:HAMP domain-containing sensor histidine kinase [Clostridium sp. MB40-C1]|uniref:sensor histidine kinase n=1 Tax=Clostridium sp. MB40-C1 TaxID=3070996 RepID=UPI0027E1C54B|nr:HAMP domain-containing sensor histidine kinase [Clostridium sp. MB40-C1]WMJ81706.1 HAMP domain-containing sensor histidine kinase [Clostridium sp. MB40-C1]
MITIRKRVTTLLIACSIIGIFLTSVIVNLTVNNKFNKYISDIQDKRNLRIVEHFEEVYRKEGKWTKNSGIEVMHEAYMGNYCIILYDSNKNVIWGMNPSDIKFKENLQHMNIKDKGVYETKNFEIKINGKIVGYISVGQYSSVLFSEEDLTFKYDINKGIITSSLFTIVIIFFISVYFSKQFSKPVKEVATMSMKLSKGDFKFRSTTKSNIQELEDLRISINILGEKLKYQDILRRRLLSDVSHEIRTPLNVLQNNLEAMVDGIFPITNERLKYLNDEVNRFSNLLGNLDILKEFEHKSVNLNFQKVDLNEVISLVCNEFYMIAKSKNINIIYDVKKDKTYEIIGDRDKLKQVFINVMSNAIKFNKSNGFVIVRLYKDKKRIIVEIEDNGVGISEEDKPFIFERLYRGDKSRNNIEGNGIGLTIVKNILELHSGYIYVESKESEGTKFTIILKCLH